LSPGGSGYFTCTQILKKKKKVTRKFKSGGLHERHVVATWKLGNHLSIRLQTQGNQNLKTKKREEKNLPRFESPQSAITTLRQALN